VAYIGNFPAEKYTTFSKQTFTPDGSTTSFTLDFSVANENDLELFVNNVRQEPGSGKAYTATGLTLTMSSAPGASDDMYAIFQGKAQQTVTPGPQTVTGSMLATDIAISTTGTITTSQVNLGDSERLRFGASQDLQIYSDGSNSRIEESGSGSLIIRGTQLILQTPIGENLAYFTTNGAAQLYHNNSEKLATTSTGIDVTGTVVSDGLTVDGTGTLSTIGNGTQQIRTYVDADEVSLLTDGSVRLDLWTGGNKTIRLDANGDISFYEDTGTTAKLFWDASAENLGIGTTSPSEKINISTKIGSQDDPDAIGLGSSYSNTAGSPSRLKVKVYDAGGENANGLGHSAQLMNIVSGLSGHSMGFFTNSGGGSTERMRIDSSGNVGIGGIPSSTIRNDITSAEKALQIGNRAMFFSDGGVTTDLQNNSHLNNSDNRVAMQTDAGSLYQQYQGVHKWFNASSVSAGATQTMTERMRIDISGNVLVGTTDNSLYNNSGAGNGGIMLGNTADGGRIDVAREGVNLIHNRLASDGIIEEFKRDGTTVGKIDANSSGISIYLGGTAGANALNDYEEGVHQVSITGSNGGSASVGDNATRLKYIKIGKEVWVHGEIHITGISGISGTMRVSLPFVVADTADLAERGVGSCALRNIDVSSGVVQVTPFCYNGQSFFTFREMYDNSSWGDIAGSALTASDEFIVSLQYTTT